LAGRRRARTSTDPLNLLPEGREQARAVAAIAGPVLEGVNVHTDHGPNTARTQRRVVGACATADVQHQVTWLRVEMIEYPVEKVIATLAVALVRLQPDAQSLGCAVLVVQIGRIDRPFHTCNNERPGPPLQSRTLKGQSSACVGCCPFSNDQSCFSQIVYNRMSATAGRWWLFDCDPDCAHTERNGGLDVLDLRVSDDRARCCRAVNRREGCFKHRGVWLAEADIQ